MYYIYDLRANQDGFDQLSSLANYIVRSRITDTLEINLSQMRWIDAHMCAPLGALLQSAMAAGRNVEIAPNIDYRVDRILRKNGFLKQFSGEIMTADKWGTVIPFRRYVSGSEKLFPGYIVRLAKSVDKLKFNGKSKEAFSQTVLELFNNSSYHANSRNGIFVCGQFYPASKILKFSIADLGVGFRSRVGTALISNLSTVESIKWSLIRGNTTRKGVSGGLGLSLLSDYMIRSGGIIQIGSRGGLLEIKEGSFNEISDFDFPGSFVNFEVSVNSEAEYILDQGDADDLF